VPDDTLRIVGTDGQLSLSVFGADPLKLETGEGTKTFEHTPPPHIQQPLIQSVVDELLGRGTCPSTGESGRRTSRIMDEVLDAYYGGREDEFWNRASSWPGRTES
jgi:hypothetical protein